MTQSGDILIVQDTGHRVIVDAPHIDGVLTFEEPIAPHVIEDTPEKMVVVFKADEGDVTLIDLDPDIIIMDVESPPLVLEQETGEDILLIPSVGPPGTPGAPGPEGPAGPPGVPGSGAEASFGFASPQYTWTMFHGMGTLAVSINLFDQNGESLEGHVRFVDLNTVEVDWYYPTAGSARVYR